MIIACSMTMRSIGEIHRLGITALERRLETGEGGQRSRDSGVPGSRVDRKKFAAGDRPFESAREPVEEKTPVGSRIVAGGGNVRVFESETDVIVATNVVEPGGAIELVRQAEHAPLQKLRVARRDAVPEQRHQGGVVGDFALLGDDRVLAEVASDLHRCDDGLGDEQHPRRHHLTAVLHQLKDEVRLPQVLTGGSELFPQKGHRIEADHIGAVIGPVENDVDHLDEDPWVGVVQIPLVGVEDRHRPLARRRRRR